MQPSSGRIEELLREANRARQGRDLWRNVGPILRELRAAKVSYQRIKAATGISPGTVARIVTTSRTGVSTRSTGTS
jgi:hypothetical protein